MPDIYKFTGMDNIYNKLELVQMAKYIMHNNANVDIELQNINLKKAGINEINLGSLVISPDFLLGQIKALNGTSLSADLLQGKDTDQFVSKLPVTKSVVVNDNKITRTIFSSDFNSSAFVFHFHPQTKKVIIANRNSGSTHSNDYELASMEAKEQLLKIIT